MNLTDVRQQLADALADVVACAVPNRGTPISTYPAAVIDITTVTPDTFGDGTYNIEATVRVLVSRADRPDGWQQLDRLLSDNTIADALRACWIVGSVGSYTSIGDDVEHDDGVFLGFEVAVLVMT